MVPINVKTLGVFAAALALAGGVCGVASASDHFDSSPLFRDRPDDLTDLFAFTPPGQPGKLALIMNTRLGVQRQDFSVPGIPSAKKAVTIGQFSPKIAYVFRVRAGQKAGTGPELRLVCAFTDASPATQRGTCTPIVFDEAGNLSSVDLSGSAVSFGLEKPTVSSGGNGGGLAMKVFGGVRADSFYTDTFGVVEYTQKKDADVFNQRKADGRLKNLLAFANVVSLAIELDPGAYFKAALPEQPATTFYRVTAETWSL
jgi:hypothetical protein